ncbi:MAG: hypothetical protein VX246_14285, partial [Myxococcota bacterium]|nr:hypothetical protein [Myxococcota bacterium]
QARDTTGNGRADTLSLIDGDGRIRVQEIAPNGSSPPGERLTLAADGSVTRHCIDGDANGTLEMQVVFEAEMLSLARVDGDGDGRIDSREHYVGGQRARIEADTNADGIPDVVQHLKGDEVVRQDEDSDYDGILDRSFEGEEAVPIAADASRLEPFGKLACKSFHGFWKTH